jgi:hypothetical protein
MRRLTAALYLFAGVVNLLPVSGALSAARLEALYGIAFREPNLLVLMRHRAILFGIVGALLVASAFRPALRPVALPAGLVSMLSFVALAWGVGDVNAELRRVAVADLVGSAALVCAAVLDARGAHSPIR